jgi:starch synthase
MRVLFIASEADPLVKVGGLGDVAGSLPRALLSLPTKLTKGEKLDIRLVIPYHAAVRQKTSDSKLVACFSIQHDDGPVPGQALSIELDGLKVYLISGSPIPFQGPVYSANAREDADKYVYFSLSALELARQLNWKPDILHANDWHTAAAVYGLTLQRADDPFFANTHSVLTIHNLPFMGSGAEESMNAFGLAPAEDSALPEWARHFPLPLGLEAADQLVAVSPTYASEILTPDFGCGLQDFLQTRQASISGIINGLDTALWDPSNDPALPVTYTAKDLSARWANKQALLAEFSLVANINLPLLAMVGRMDQQKGFDLAIKALHLLPDAPWQAILLGTGDPIMEEACRKLEKEFPDRVRAAIRFDTQLSRRIYGGADMLLMPSRYEPCGLAQMIAMRYGCVPIARATGGLKDTIIDLPETTQSTGFLFDEASPEALATAIQRGLDCFQDRQEWQNIQLQGMKQDFSWRQSALAYAQIYFNLMEKKP